MKPIIIGLTPRVMNNAEKVQLNYSYLQPFNKRSVATIILPLGSNELDTILPLCDGFLIAGGDDIDPKHYNQINEGLSKDVCPLIDDLDKAVIEHAYKNHKPMLGICRGIQSLAAFLGGDLHQDIEQAKLTHTVENNVHDVVKVASTPLTDLMPDNYQINSYHHQVVKQVPKDFIVTYMHDDVIEGMEHKTLPIIGFQWHPERLATKETEIIFDYFVDLVKKAH